MATTTIPVQGTFDIALGRKTLRANIVRQRWHPNFNARASAALTALGELILMGDTSRLVPIIVHILDQGNQHGIEMTCNVNASDIDDDRVDEATSRLERAADELLIDRSHHGIRVTVYIWC